MHAIPLSRTAWIGSKLQESLLTDIELSMLQDCYIRYKLITVHRLYRIHGVVKLLSLSFSSCVRFSFIHFAVFAANTTKM